jgi:hypothetical protein
MKQKFSHRPNLEWLEERDCPAPLHFLFNPTSGDLHISGTPDVAGLLIEATGAPDTFDITDGATLVLDDFVIPGGININFNTASDDAVTLDLTAGGLSGNLTVNMGGQSFLGDFLEIIGPNGIGGNVNLTGVNSVNNFTGASVGGSVTINNSRDNVINMVNWFNSSVGTNFSYYGGSDLDNLAFVGSFIGGNLTASMGNFINSLDFSGGFLGGNLNYIGGSGSDLVDLSGVVGGNVTLNMGAAIGFTNDLAFTGVIGGSLTYSGGLGTDAINTFTGDVGGNVYFSLGDGDNELNLTGTIGGTSATILTGLGEDDVTYAMTGSSVRLYANLGGGADLFTLGDGVDNPTLSYLYIDFGSGIDDFNNQFIGAFTFTAFLRNLP